MAIPSGQLNTPLRAGIAPGPATARRLAGTLALSTDPMRANTPTGAHTHSAAAAHATTTPRRDVRTARNRTQRRLPVGRGTPAHAYHIGHIGRRRLALPCAMALGDGHMLGGEQAASCMEYGVVSASTMAYHAASHTLCVASRPRRLSETASPARITQNLFTDTRRVKHARRHAEARRAESSLGSLSVRT